MRILVHEFVTGGGLAGRDVPVSLAREGAAMLEALVADLAAIPGHEIVVTMDARFPPAVPPGVEVVGFDGDLDSLTEGVDAVWFVAPETGGCLERLVAGAEAQGKRILGSGSAAIRRASDKAALARLLAGRGVAHPLTCVLNPQTSPVAWETAARRIGYPVVVKPRRGAGCEGVVLVRDAEDLDAAVRNARRIDSGGAWLVQQFVPGLAASVSLVADGVRAIPLAVSAQWIRIGRGFHYAGGTTPLEHPNAEVAAEVAVRAVDAFPGLRGYVGVDLVLTDSEAVVIEINPRLTTAYVGVRSVLETNVAEMAMAACEGRRPDPVRPDRRVSFDSGGHIVETR